MAIQSRDSLFQNNLGASSGTAHEQGTDGEPQLDGYGEPVLLLHRHRSGRCIHRLTEKERTHFNHPGNDVLLSLILIVPFLLLAAAGIVMIGGETP